MTKLKVLELFSGIGAQHKALNDINIDSECTQCDIDKYAIQSYNAIFGETPNLGDISLIKEEELQKDQWDLVTYSSPCFVGDTMIWVEDKDGNEKYIPIKDFNDNYKVFTINLDDYAVTTKPAKLLNQGIKDTVNVTFSNNETISCTDNHKFYSDNEWKEIKTLVGKEVTTLDNINHKLFQFVDMKFEEQLLYVNEIKQSKKQEVYDLSVEDYHWFFIKVGNEKVLVHNCQDFSFAGLQAGGEKGSGTRSSLLWEVEKVIRAVRPKYLLMENVKALVSKKFKPCFDKWIETLDSYGYKTKWQVLNAKNFGIPQNRERVFVVSIRNDIEQEYEFPEGFPLTIRLKDILEDNVDKKYYLSDEIQKRFKYEPKGENIVGTTKPEYRSIGQRDEVFNTDGVMGALVATDYKQPKQIFEPTIVASRGRNPDNPSDRSTGAHLEQRLEENSQGIANTLTSVQKDNWVLEPNVLTPKRTDYGKEVRKAYESGELKESRHNMTQLEPRTDGVSNTLTSVQKDNWVAEPQIEVVGNYKPSGHECGRIMDIDGISPTIKENHGAVCAIAEPQENRLFNIYGEDKGTGYAGNVWDKEAIAPTLKTMQGGNSQPMIISDERMTQQAYETLQENDCNDGDVINPFNKKVVNDGICPTLTTRPEGFKTANLIVENEDKVKVSYKIRKLTPKECWRLMGFTDEDFQKAQDSGVSNCQLYKQAGNSIVVNVLSAIFYNLFKDTEYYCQNWLEKTVDEIMSKQEIKEAIQKSKENEVETNAVSNLSITSEKKNEIEIASYNDIQYVPIQTYNNNISVFEEKVLKKLDRIIELLYFMQNELKNK